MALSYRLGCEVIATTRSQSAAVPGHIRQPLQNKTTDLLILSEGQRAPVARPRLVAAAQAPQHIRAGKVEWGVAFQSPGALDPLEQREALLGACRERYRD